MLRNRGTETKFLARTGGETPPTGLSRGTKDGRGDPAPTNYFRALPFLFT